MPAVTELPEAIRVTLEPRVADGVLYFDNRAPGWALLVDLTRLDMGNPCLCVLGHVTGLANVIDLGLPGLWAAACSAFGIADFLGQDADLGLNADAPEILAGVVSLCAVGAGYPCPDPAACDDPDGCSPCGTYLADVAQLELRALQDVWVKVIAQRQGAAGQQAGRALAARWAAR